MERMTKTGFTNHSIEAILNDTQNNSDEENEPPVIKPAATKNSKQRSSKQVKRTSEHLSDEERGLSTSIEGSSSAAVDNNKSSETTGQQKRPKRPRHTYTLDQIRVLETFFQLTKGFLESSTRIWLAKVIGVEPDQAQVWFQNRRSKCRKREYPVYRQLPAPLYICNNDILSLLPEHLAAQIAPQIAQQLALHPPPSYALEHQYTAPHHLPPNPRQ